MDWEQELREASAVLHREAGPIGSSAVSLGIRTGHERRYAAAFRMLVKQGKRPPLRAKYREV